MNTITNYRKRFFSLLESEMGNVKPLITEEANDQYIQKAINDIVAFANTKVNEIKSKNPKSNIPTFTTERVELSSQNSVAYKIKWGVTPLTWNGSDLSLDISLPGKSVVAAISAYFNPTSGDAFAKKLNSPYYGQNEKDLLKTIQPQAVKIMNQAYTPATATPTQKTPAQKTPAQQPVKKP
jgi:hypothetical protein